MTEYSKLTTEGFNENTANIDKMSPLEIAKAINEEDKKVAFAVEKALPQIAEGIETIANALKAGGHIYYCGAGTSGRLGVLDASECVPTFGVSADIVNEYDAFFATDVRVILKEAATAADDVELCQTFPESVNAEPSDDFIRITCGNRPDFLTDLIMPACTAAPEHRLDHALRDILRVKAAELSPDFPHANGHAVLFCGNALFDWLPVHDAHDIHGSVANIDEHIFAGHITGMKHGSVPLRENEDLPDMDPVVLSPEIKFGIDVLHEIFAEFIFLPGDPGKRKTCRQDYICIAKAPHIEFFRDGCQRQDEKIIRICLLALVSHVVLTDHIILIPVSDKVPADDRFLIGSVHTGEKDFMSGLNIPVTVIHTNNHRPHFLDLFLGHQSISPPFSSNLHRLS